MNANNLTFEQIKELAEIAAKNKCNFNLDISGENINIYINQPEKSSVTTINPYTSQIYYANDTSDITIKPEPYRVTTMNLKDFISLTDTTTT